MSNKYGNDSVSIEELMKIRSLLTFAGACGMDLPSDPQAGTQYLKIVDYSKPMEEQGIICNYIDGKWINHFTGEEVFQMDLSLKFKWKKFLAAINYE